MKEDTRLTIPLSRRLFIGLLGGTLAASFIEPWALTTTTLPIPRLGGRLLVDSLFFMPTSRIPVECGIGRSSGPILLKTLIDPDCYFRLHLVPGSEFVFLDNDPWIIYPIDAGTEWDLTARGSDGRRFLVRGHGSVLEPPIFMELE